MIKISKLYYFYNLRLFKAIEILIVFLTLGSYFIFGINSVVSKLLVLILGYLVVFQIFIDFKIARILPNTDINKSTNPSDLLTLKACYLFISSKGLSKNFTKFLSFKGNSYILGKLETNPKDIKLLDIKTDIILQNSLEIAKKTGGKYITSMDILVSYLLLTEKDTKLLFEKEIKKESLFTLLKSARKYFSEEENKRLKPLYNEEGLFESFVSGWTPETNKYTLDRTSDILSQGELIIQRDEVFNQAINALSQIRKNSLLVVGDVGVGKQSLIYSLMFDSM